MKLILITLKKMLFWSYERGSWQYDLMCVLILAFIFLSPNRFFQSRGESRPLTERKDEIGKFDPNESRSIDESLVKNDSNAASVSRIENFEDGSGISGYLAWRKTAVRSVQLTEKQNETK